MKFEINGVLAIKDQYGCNMMLERVRDATLRKELVKLFNELNAVLVTQKTQEPYYSFTCHVPCPFHEYLTFRRKLNILLESYDCYPLLFSYSERNLETDTSVDIDMATPSNGILYSLNHETGQEEISDKENPHLIKELLYNYSYSIPYYLPVSITIN